MSEPIKFPPFGRAWQIYCHLFPCFFGFFLCCCFLCTVRMKMGIHPDDYELWWSLSSFVCLSWMPFGILSFFYRLFVILSRETSNLKTYFNKPSESYFLYKCTAFLSQICLFMKYVKIHIKYLSKPGHPISSKNILRCAVSIRPSNFTAPLYISRKILRQFVPHSVRTFWQ